MKQILIALMFTVACWSPASAFTIWFDEDQSMEVVELQPGQSANQDIHCLAQNIYWEARNQSRPGMIAVARVTMNRVKDKRFPDTICEVVKEGPLKESWKTKQDPDLAQEERVYYPRRNRCQFSWYCDGKSDEIPRVDIDFAWRVAQEIAINVIYEDRWRGIVDGATHYHATYVRPMWRHELHYVTRIDDHLFYRWD